MDGPALRPPLGVRPNFDAVDLAHIYIASLVIIMTISTILIAVRAYTRFVVMKQHGAEDYTLFLGWALTIVFFALSGVAHQYGLGKHQWNVRLRTLLDVVYWLNVCTIFYDLAFMLVKLSIVTQYRKIFVPKSKRSFMWWGTWGLSFCFVALYTILAFVNIFQCVPRAKIWTPKLPGRCLDVSAIRLSSASINTVTDFVILFMPQRSLWRLNVPVRTRVKLAGIFLIGLFACIASCVRLYFTVQLSKTADVTYVAMQFGLWTGAELGSGIICACLPVFPRFLKHTSLYDRFGITLQSLLSRGRRSGSGSKGSASSVPSTSRHATSAHTESSERLNLSEDDGKSWPVDAEHGIKKTVAIELNSKGAGYTTFNPTKPTQW